MTRPDDYNRINLRLSHPNLFRSILVFAFINIGMGINFLLTVQPFNGYDIDKNIVGTIFLTLGIMKLMFIRVHRSLRHLRITMSIEVIWMLVWGFSNAITWHQGKTSLQQFVLYVGLAAFEASLLSEPFSNPLTSKQGGTTDD